PTTPFRSGRRAPGALRRARRDRLGGRAADRRRRPPRPPERPRACRRLGARLARAAGARPRGGDHGAGGGRARLPRRARGARGRGPAAHRARDRAGLGLRAGAPRADARVAVRARPFPAGRRGRVGGKSFRFPPAGPRLVERHAHAAPPRSILPSAPGRPEPHRMTRRILAPAVVPTWPVTVGWQVRRAYFRTELALLSEAARALAPGVSFYTLTMGSRAVGQATSRLDTIPGGFVLDDRMSLELPALGQTGTAVVRTLVELDESLVMRSFG